MVVKSPTATSPGLPAELLQSKDGGATWTEHVITTLAYNDDPSGLAIVGSYIVVISNDSGSLHYADEDDLDTWTEVTAGFEALHAPNGIFALDSANVWIVGDGGYIYYSDDIESGVVVQNSGAATSEDLYAVHGCSGDVVIACGANGALVSTANGGVTWLLCAATALLAVDFRACWARQDTTWLVGGVGGVLYATRDAGVTWMTIGFTSSGGGTIYDLVFCGFPDAPFGFMVHTPATGRGQILQTIDGGNSWQRLPSGTGVVPNNTRLTCVAGCRNPNVVLAGGLGVGGVDGIAIVGS